MSSRPLLVLLCLVLAGCVVGDGPDEDTTVTAPTFAPEDDEPPDASGNEATAATEPASEPETGTPAPDEPDEPDAATGEVQAEQDDGTGDPAPSGSSPSASSRQEKAEPRSTDAPEPTVLRSRVTDPRGDVESMRLESPPSHADLAAASLARDADGYRLTIEVDGGVPEHARDGNHTMNVASFYDLTGDGHVDVEVWANLADGGWDSAHYDNRARTAVFSDEDDIAVSVEEGRLVLGFPLDVLDGAERFRWAVASEWGRYEELGAPTSARDEMPDDGAPAPFPG